MAGSFVDTTIGVSRPRLAAGTTYGDKLNFTAYSLLQACLAMVQR